MQRHILQMMSVSLFGAKWFQRFTMSLLQIVIVPNVAALNLIHVVAAFTKGQ
jgi:hypothetical protein